MHVAHARCGGVLSVARHEFHAHSRWSGCFPPSTEADACNACPCLCDVEYCTAYRSSTARLAHTDLDLLRVSRSISKRKLYSSIHLELFHTECDVCGETHRRGLSDARPIISSHHSPTRRGPPPCACGSLNLQSSNVFALKVPETWDEFVNAARQQLLQQQGRGSAWRPRAPLLIWR